MPEPVDPRTAHAPEQEPDQQPATPRPDPRPLPRHVTTPLLQLITEQSMDADYAHVAAKNARLGNPPRRLSWASVVLMAMFAALATVVVVQNKEDAGIRALSRDALERQVDRERDEVTRLQRRVQALTAQGRQTDSASRSMKEQIDEDRARVRRLEIRTGYVAVHGPGVRFEIASAPDAEPNDEVRDEDLALLVNGLFEAGAEAVAINDQRVVALGGIRNTGRAVHVNGRPLTPPYTVTAIGDAETLQSRLVETASGLIFLGLVNDIPFTYDARNVQDLRLPAASLRTLRQATSDPQSTDSSQQEGTS